MLRPLKWGILSACTIIFDKVIHKKVSNFENLELPGKKNPIKIIILIAALPDTQQKPLERQESTLKTSTIKIDAHTAKWWFSVTRFDYNGT